jgi:hypothetical protein
MPAVGDFSSAAGVMLGIVQVNATRHPITCLNLYNGQGVPGAARNRPRMP